MLMLISQQQLWLDADRKENTSTSNPETQKKRKKIYYAQECKDQSTSESVSMRYTLQSIPGGLKG